MYINPKLQFNPREKDSYWVEDPEGYQRVKRVTPYSSGYDKAAAGHRRQQYTDWKQDVETILGIEYSSWLVRDINNDDIEDFNEIPYPSARQVYYDGGMLYSGSVNHGLPGLIRVTHQLSYGMIWQIADKLINHSNSFNTLILGITYDDKGTISIITQ